MDNACRVRYHRGVLFDNLGLADIAVGDRLPDRPGAAGAVRRAVLRAIAGEDVLVSVATHDVAVELRFSPNYEDDGTINGLRGWATAHRGGPQRAEDIGSTIAPDDFGTGYSSLPHLRELPVDTIKIDRSFVGAMDGDSGSRAIVRAIATLGIDLGLRVVVEGVETQSALDAIASYGCTSFQGYLRAMPSDLNQFLSGLSESKPL